jgi:hypothetical protein
MSAMAKFKDVVCAPCFRAGHRCQAQIVSSVEVTRIRRGQESKHLIDQFMCLRCADNEPCYQVTSAAIDLPKRYDDMEQAWNSPLRRSGRHGETYAQRQAA